MKEIYGALAKAQKNFEAALKNATNPHFRSKYALGVLLVWTKPAWPHPPCSASDQTQNAVFGIALVPVTSRLARSRHPEHFELRVSSIRSLQFEGESLGKLGMICNTL